MAPRKQTPRSIPLVNHRQHSPLGSTTPASASLQSADPNAMRNHQLGSLRVVAWTVKANCKTLFDYILTVLAKHTSCKLPTFTLLRTDKQFSNLHSFHCWRPLLGVDGADPPAAAMTTSGHDPPYGSLRGAPMLCMFTQHLPLAQATKDAHMLFGKSIFHPTAT